jgi:hypothetical protein
LHYFNRLYNGFNIDVISIIIYIIKKEIFKMKLKFLKATFTSFIISVTCLAATTSAANAALVELITNGGFETGTLAGWTSTDQAGSDGNWSIDNDGLTPLSGTPTVGSSSGSFYAVTDQTGPGTHALEQSFFVPVGVSCLMLTFDMFVNDGFGSGAIVDPLGLDYTGGPNQHARVDIMTAAAGLFSTAAIDITSVLIAPMLDSFASNPNPYTTYMFDLTSILTPGGTYKLRFAEVDNQLFLNQGIDNVSLIANTTEVPAPSTLAIFALAMIGLGSRRLKK